MGNEWFAVVPTGFVLVIAVFGWVGAPRAARRRLDKLAAGIGLELDDRMRVLVEGRLRRRQRGIMAGMVGGGIAGSLLAVMQAGEVNSGVWWVAVYLVGIGLGVLTAHVLDSLRAAAEPGQRAAVLRPRRLRDFMFPAEIAAPYVVLVLPAAAVALVVGSGGTGEPGAAVGVAVVAALVAAATAAAQRFVLHMAPPADSPARLKWEDALRGVALRDLGATTYCTSFALGGAALLNAAIDAFLLSAPTLLAVAYGVVGVAMIGLVVLVVAAESVHQPARRFLRLYDDAPAGGQR